MYNNRFNGQGRKFKFLFILPLVALLSLIVMLLWNGILPELLHTRTITYGQAAGLFILCKILFGGFGFFGRGGHRGGPPDMRDKFMRMTTEEREKLKAQWQERYRQRK